MNRLKPKRDLQALRRKVVAESLSFLTPGGEYVPFALLGSEAQTQPHLPPPRASLSLSLSLCQPSTSSFTRPARRELPHAPNHSSSLFHLYPFAHSPHAPLPPQPQHAPQQLSKPRNHIAYALFSCCCQPNNGLACSTNVADLTQPLQYLEQRPALQSLGIQKGRVKRRRQRQQHKPRRKAHKATQPHAPGRFQTMRRLSHISGSLGWSGKGRGRGCGARAETHRVSWLTL